MNISELIQSEIQNINVDSLFKEELEKQVRETVRKTLKDQLGSYSILSKSLEKYLEENVKIDYSRVSVPQYTNFVVEKCFDVVNELMNEEQSLKIKKHFRDRLAPHLTEVVIFGDLIDAISDSLKEVIKEASKESCCDIPEFRIVCEKDESDWKLNGDYWSLKIYEGKEKKHDREMASVFFNNGKCYHSRGKKNDEFAKRFASYVYNNTIIEQFEEVDDHVDQNILY